MREKHSHLVIQLNIQSREKSKTIEISLFIYKRVKLWYDSTVNKKGCFMFELEEIVSYKVFGREFSKKEDALKYSMTLQNRQNLLDKLDLKILKIKDWSMEILVDGHRILILNREDCNGTRALYKQVDKNGRNNLIELGIYNLPILSCKHGVTYKSLISVLRESMLFSNVEKLIEEINRIKN